jgi:ribonuclease HII
MAIVVGVDEAGYGPTLGPLVITGAAFEVRDHEVNGNLWQILEGAVAGRLESRGRSKIRHGESVRLRRSTTCPHRLVVADSKRLYSSGITGRKLRRLEEGVLVFQRCLNYVEDLKGLLDALCCYDKSGLEPYPWYQNLQLGLPVVSTVEKITRYRQHLQEVLTSRGIKFLGARAVVLSPYEFNKGVKACGNKALLLFDSCVKLVNNLWEEFPRLEIFCDKHGGRNRYALLLSRAFSACKINVLSEGRDVSSYELRDDTSRMKVSFVLKAEDKYLPVALASMYSKYVRELFMELFNQYWQERIPGLRPTAGYPEDARRFLKEISTLRTQLGIDDELIIRRR